VEALQVGRDEDAKITETDKDQFATARDNYCFPVHTVQVRVRFLRIQ
jgi:hypothetical protein